MLDESISQVADAYRFMAFRIRNQLIHSLVALSLTEICSGGELLFHVGDYVSLRLKWSFTSSSVGFLP